VKNKKSSSIYLLCSPNLGLLDNWLPVIYELKKHNANLDCKIIITSSETMMSINFDNAIVSISNDIFDSVIFLSSANLLMHTDSLKAAKEICSVSSSVSRFLRYCNYSKKYYFLNFFAHIFFTAYKCIEFVRYKDNCVSVDSIITSNDILLYDVHVKNFPFEKSIIALFRHKFSMPHGIDITVSNNHKNRLANNIDLDSDLTLYLFSDFQCEKYINKYGVNESSFAIYGIPRHDSNWVEIIQSRSDKLGSSFKDNETVVIFSSPYTESDSYLPKNKKQEIIEDIKKVVIDNLGMKIAVKIHPKEDKGRESIYEEIFGLDQYGKTWVYSNLHPFALASGKKFVITMWSGVCFDMIKIGVQCIEYVDFRSVKGFENYDLNGDKISPFVYYGFAIGVRNHEQFVFQVKQILKISDKRPEVYVYMSKHKKYIPVVDGVSNKIALDILSKVA
jgi:hypothetical protein